MIKVNGEPIRYDLCPVRYMAGAMERYLEHGIMPGHFGEALLCNDFMEMCRRADENNQQAFFEWGRWLYNYAPSGSYGSPEAVRDYVKSRQPNP
jgi:hypothetical protein